MSVLGNLTDALIAKLQPLLMGTFGVPVFAGAGLNDLTVRLESRYTGAANALFEIEMEVMGTPDIIRWRKDAGPQTSIPMTGGDQLLQDGLITRWPATTGHSVLDFWFIAATAGTGFMREVSALDFRLDAEADVEAIIRAIQARIPAAFLSVADSVEVEDESKAANAIEVFYIVNCKLAVVFPTVREDERRTMDFATFDQVNDLLTRQPIDPIFFPTDYAFHPIVMNGSTWFRTADIAMRIFDFSVVAHKVCTSM